MRWISHTLIAWAVSAPFGASPVVLLGATAPDWVEKIVLSRHREATHALLVWALPAIFSLLLFFAASSPLQAILWHLFWWFWGGVIHWICDALTPSGVLLTPWSREKVTLFGGRIRTGETAEYALAVGVCLISFVFFGWGSAWEGQKKFSCFLVRAKWCEASRERVSVAGEEIPLVSPAELRKHRFEW